MKRPLRWVLLLVAMTLMLPDGVRAWISYRGLPNVPTRHADWPDGVLEVITDAAQVGGWRVNDMHAPTGYDVYAMDVGTTEDANRLIRKLAAIKGPGVRLELDPARMIGEPILPSLQAPAPAAFITGPKVNLAALFEDEPALVDGNLTIPAFVTERMIDPSPLEDMLRSRLSLERASPQTQPSETKPVVFDDQITLSRKDVRPAIVFTPPAPPRWGMSLGQSIVRSYEVRPTKVYPFTLRLCVPNHIDLSKLEVPLNVEVGFPAWPPVLPDPQTLGFRPRDDGWNSEIIRFIEAHQAKQAAAKAVTRPTTRARD